MTRIHTGGRVGGGVDLFIEVVERERRRGRCRRQGAQLDCHIVKLVANARVTDVTLGAWSVTTTE